MLFPILPITHTHTQTHTSHAHTYTYHIHTYMLTCCSSASSLNHLQNRLKILPPFLGGAAAAVVVGCHRWQLIDSGAVSTCTPEPETGQVRDRHLLHRRMSGTQMLCSVQLTLCIIQLAYTQYSVFHICLNSVSRWQSALLLSAAIIW